MIPPQASLHTLELCHPARLRRERRWEHVGQGYEHPCPWLDLPLQSASKPQQCHLQRKEGDTQLELSRSPLHSPQPLQEWLTWHRGDTGLFGGHRGCSLLFGVCLLLMLCPVCSEQRPQQGLRHGDTWHQQGTAPGQGWAAGQPPLLWGICFPPLQQQDQHTPGHESVLAAPVPRST